MKVFSAGATDTGKKRRNNEDAYLLNDPLCLYAVADGVGGAEGGEIASRIAVDTLAAVLPDLLGEKDRTPPSGLVRDDDPRFSALRQAVAFSNRGIRRARELKPALSDMGTTLTVLLLRRDHAFIVHVGDSRAYLLRSGVFTQLTEDHSVVAEQVRAGILTPDQVRTSSNRHVITRALGMNEDVKPDFMQQAVRRDDRFLLCTDGLTEMVVDAEISKILAASAPRDAVQKLVAAANDRGGVDNITAVVVWVMEV